VAAPRWGSAGVALRLARSALAWISIVAVALLASQSPGHSEFLVDGSRDNLVVKADQTPLSDIVDALRNKFNVRLKSQISLDARIDGRFSGPLIPVLRRLLEPYNFALALGQDGDTNSIVIIVLGQIKQTASYGNSPQVMPRPVAATKVRRPDDE
jgi:hypothetical protein